MGVIERVGGVVLCGGESSRMGSSKAWLDVGGEAMLQRVVRRLGGAVSPIVVVAAPDQDVPELPEGAAIVRDAIAGRGPLQGLAAGLSALVGRADAAFVAATDAPFLHPAFVRRLVALRRAGDAIVAPITDGQPHPLAALYDVEVRHVVEALLAEGVRRVRALFDRAPTRFVDRATLLADSELAARDPHLASLRNVNTPEDYAAALREELSSRA